MKKRDAGDKHAEVTGASLLRRAKAHGVQAESHRRVANDISLSVETRRHHATIGMMHDETAKILRGEAKEIRGQR